MVLVHLSSVTGVIANCNSTCVPHALAVSKSAPLLNNDIDLKLTFLVI